MRQHKFDCTVVLHLANREQCMPWKSLKVFPANEPKTLDQSWQWFAMTLLEITKRNVPFSCFSPWSPQKHRNLKVEQCCLFVISDRPYIAGSPDGIVSYNCCPKAVLEIKCPFILADKSVKDGWNNWTQNIGSKLTMVCNDPFGDHKKKCSIFRPVTAICPCNRIDDAWVCTDCLMKAVDW
jgi:hypothetical protein